MKEFKYKSFNSKAYLVKYVNENNLIPISVTYNNDPVYPYTLFYYESSENSKEIK